MNYHIVKLSNGEDILCTVLDKQETQIKIESPLLMETVSRPTATGVVESLALGRWVQPYSDEEVFLIEKNSIVIMTPASAGLSRYYEHILKNIDVVLKTKSPSDEDLDRIEMEDRDEQENLVAEEDLEAILENFEVDDKTFH